MLKLPNLVGLVLCRDVIVDAKPRNVTLVNTFHRLQCPAFPSPPQRFILYAVLTDGLGDATMSVDISRPDTLDELFEQQWPVRFADSLRHVRLTVRFGSIVFSVPGRYQVCLNADRQWIGQTVFDVFS